MFEVVVTYKRPDTSVDFFAFQTKNVDGCIFQSKFRNDMLNAPGFLGMSYVLSEDKLTLKMFLLWESYESTNNFKSRFKEVFEFHSVTYNKENQISISFDVNNLPDTKNLKYKKLSSRIYAKKAGEELKNFITERYEKESG